MVQRVAHAPLEIPAASGLQLNDRPIVVIKDVDIAFGAGRNPYRFVAR